MKISLSIEKDERHEVTIQCCVQGFSETEAKQHWAELVRSADRFLGQEGQGDSETLPIRHGVFF
jgi:hypothetical protein